MAKLAPSFFYDWPKFVPLGGSMQCAQRKSGSDGKPLNLRSYTLCEVPEKSRQELPMANKGTSNLPNRNLRLPNRTTSPS